MRIALFILLTGCLGLIVAPAARAADLTGSPPTTRPAVDDVAGLIAQLGDPDFRVRRDATVKLRERGPAVLPELRQASEDKNPEIRARAAQIVRVLEYHPIPGRPALHGGFARQRRVSFRIDNGRKSVDVDDFGRRIQITEGDDGIEMTVTGETDGRPDTQTYRARNAEQLRAENPDAFTVYQRYAQAGGVDPDGGFGFQGNVILQGNGNMILIPRFQQPAAVFTPHIGGDDLAGLRLRLDDEMNKSNLPPVQKERVHNAIDRVAQAGGIDPAAAPLDGEDERIAHYDKACDDLRAVLKNLNLPDPGQALPPPRSARLGVNVTPDPLSGSIIVAHVLPHSRAERIGLQDDDVIRKINGKPVPDVKDLRRLVTENPEGLVVQVTRDGRDVKLEEKNEVKRDE